MNWHRAKTILICFFLFINAFLLYFNVSKSRYDSKINEQIIGYTTDILKGNGISIDPEIIPKKRLFTPQFEADNIITDYAEFAKSVLGKDAAKISDTEYSSAKGNLEFSGDSFNFTSSAPLFSGSLKRADAVSLLDGLGIKIGDFDYEKNGNSVILSNKANDFNIFNSEIVIENTDTATKISGIWFSKLGDNFPQNAELNDITSVLIDLLSSSQKPQGETSITTLKLGYIIYEPEKYHKTLVPIPVWCIEHTGGTVYMDARANS